MSNENIDKEFLEIEIKRLYSSLNAGVFDNNEVTKKSIATYLWFLESSKVFPSEFEIIFGMRKWRVGRTLGLLHRTDRRHEGN